MVSLCRIVYYCLLLVMLALMACSSPRDDEFVEDLGGLLNQAQIEHIKEYHEVLLRDLDVHFKLVITDESIADLDQMAAEKFGRLGEKTSAAKGLLFLVDPKSEQVRIEVGYDLEHVFPDGFVGYLEEKQMAPFFEVGKVGQGVEATGELLVGRMIRFLDGKDFEPAIELGSLQHYSGGGGAKVDVSIASKELTKENSSYSGEYKPGDSPLSTLEMYQRVLKNHVKDPRLSIFTPETRDFFSKWVVTDAQQDNELRSLENNQPEQILIDGDFAVIRYPVGKRTCAPYFLKLGDKGWMLDFWTMSQSIRMNHKNQWMLKEKDHPYMFAFDDWRFDNNGFPFKK